MKAEGIGGVAEDNRETVSKSAWATYLPIFIGAFVTLILSWFTGISAAKTELVALQARFDVAQQQSAEHWAQMRSDLSVIRSDVQKMVGEIGELRGMEGRRQ